MSLADDLRAVCPQVHDGAPVEGRDWWPIGLRWALEGRDLAPPFVVARPSSVDELSAVLAWCNDAGVPVTAAGGRSGVSGGAVPVHGGVVVETTGLNGEPVVDDVSLLATAPAGLMGDRYEALLRAGGFTGGHWPQSIALSTVGGWIACRGAGQLSNRYGKVEDLVTGLEVVLADGRVLRTGGHPRTAQGSDLTQLFVGSEGTLGIVTEVTMRVFPLPTSERRAAWRLPTFEAGLEACRLALRAGAAPAVLRLYDAVEAARSYGIDQAVLLLLDEGDAAIVDAVVTVVSRAVAAAGGTPEDDALVGRWLEHRNDVQALHDLTARGIVVDTMEVSAPWASLPGIYARTVAALTSIDGMLAASAHQSHAYSDGACLYFTFAGEAPDGDRDRFYVAAWDAAQGAALAAGASLSHHHGVGLNRARFMETALGPVGVEVLQRVKDALDPKGVLNPGKLGLRSPFGEVAWP